MTTPTNDRQTSERERTHGENCYLWDRHHYECALREIERLRAQLRADEAEIEGLKASVAELLDYAADARRTSEYWKGEHNAANAVIERLQSELAALRERVAKARVEEE